MTRRCAPRSPSRPRGPRGLRAPIALPAPDVPRRPPPTDAPRDRADDLAPTPDATPTPDAGARHVRRRRLPPPLSPLGSCPRVRARRRPRALLRHPAAGARRPLRPRARRETAAPTVSVGGSLPRRAPRPASGRRLRPDVRRLARASVEGGALPRSGPPTCASPGPHAALQRLGRVGRALGRCSSGPTGRRRARRDRRVHLGHRRRRVPPPRHGRRQRQRAPGHRDRRGRRHLRAASEVVLVPRSRRRSASTARRVALRRVHRRRQRGRNHRGHPRARVIFDATSARAGRPPSTPPTATPTSAPPCCAWWWARNSRRRRRPRRRHLRERRRDRRPQPRRPRRRRLDHGNRSGTATRPAACWCTSAGAGGGFRARPTR